MKTLRLLGSLLCALVASLDAAGAQSGAGAPAPSGQGSQTVWTSEERAAIELLRSLRKRERPDDHELAVRLSVAGERVLPLFFELLAARSIPALEAGEAQILSEVQEKVLLLAVAQLDRAPVLAQVAVALPVDADPRRRLAALACVGAVGRANDLPQLFELALGPDEVELDEKLGRALRRAVTAVLAHDPRAFEQLVTLRRITRPELLAILVEAVGATRNPQGLVFLSEVAYWNEALIQGVMSQVPALGPSGDEAIDGALKVRLRAYLDEDQPGPCRAAIAALTALRDEDAIAALIALLGSESAGLRESAHWALRQLTGLALAPAPDAWARWHQGELYWLVRQKPREFQRLRESDPGVVADALRTILVHPLARHELASALPDLLKSRWPAMRVLACRTLADLEARNAIPRLVWALEDKEPEVSTAAHAALRRLTRLELPREPLAWQAATNTEPRGTEL